MQHCGCHGEHCRRTERHSWVISPHLARPCRSLREPARPTRALCLAYIGTGEEAGSTTANGGETKNQVRERKKTNG
jgi:hypothetical protein